MSLEYTRRARFITGAGNLIVIAGLGMLLLSGCSGFGGSSTAWLTPPWSRKPAEPPKPRVAIKSPYLRMTELAELAKRAGSLSVDEQQRQGTALAAEFRAEGDPLIRAQIVRTLEKFQTADASAVLREAMEDSSIDVRIAACEVWGDRRGPEAVELLGARVAGDTNVDVRVAAARALGETGQPGAVPKLAVALDDANPALQYVSVLSLQKVTGKQLDNDVNQWRQYVKGETPTAAPPMSLAERVRQMF